MEENILENAGIENADDKHTPPKELLNEAIDKMDKEIFFSASQARTKTTAVHKKKLECEMLPIYQKINEAISKGEYRIWIKLSKDQRNFLSNKNFNISLKNNVDGNVYECLLYWD